MKAIPQIKKNDDVYVLRGKDRGKTGRVLIVLPQKKRVVVEGVQMIKRPHASQPAEEHQGWHRREGSVDSHIERGGCLQELQGTHAYRYHGTGRWTA